MLVNELHALLPLPTHFDGLVFLLPWPLIPILLWFFSQFIFSMVAWHSYRNQCKQIASLTMFVTSGNFAIALLLSATNLFYWGFLLLLLSLIGFIYSLLRKRTYIKPVFSLLVSSFIQYQAIVILIGVMAKT